MEAFIQALHRFERVLSSVKNKGIPLEDGEKATVWDFKAQQEEGLRNEYYSLFDNLKSKTTLLYPLVQKNNAEAKQLTDLVTDLQPKDLEKAVQIVSEMVSLAKKLPVEKRISSGLPQLPEDISGDVKADMSELQKCFDAGSYRSCVILCGRVLETALHRKYYDATGHDVLEKSPGIGLGNLIAKMKEKGIELDPAISQQIHLINQVRIFSVHKKKQVFMPTSEQAQAIILYTTAVLRDLFS